MRDAMGPILLGGKVLPMFPCLANKKPATPRAFKDATTDPAAIAGLWWSHWGPLIGLPTGERSGLDVLDVDVDGLSWFDRNSGRLPLTRMHETRSGGRHLFFRHRPGLRCSTSKIELGVDVRADGGYVIWWPKAGYRVLCKGPIAPWPASLDAALAEAEARKAWETQQKHKTAFPMNHTTHDALVVRVNQDDNRFVPKQLHARIIELMPGARPIHQRRVRGILRVLVQTRQLRNEALRDAAIQFRELIDAGIIPRADAEQLLFMAAEINGYVAKDGVGDAWRTIRSGLNYQTTRASWVYGGEEKAE